MIWPLILILSPSLIIYIPYRNEIDFLFKMFMSAMSLEFESKTMHLTLFAIFRVLSYSLLQQQNKLVFLNAGYTCLVG